MLNKIFAYTLAFGNLEEHGSDLSATHSHPICLATREHVDQEDSLVSGWGTTSSGSREYILFNSISVKTNW